jgi:hypothetical protein
MVKNKTLARLEKYKKNEDQSWSIIIDDVLDLIPDSNPKIIDLAIEKIKPILNIIKDTKDTKHMLDNLQVIFIKAYNSPKNMKFINKKFEEILDEIVEMKNHADKKSPK